MFEVLREPAHSAGLLAVHGVGRFRGFGGHVMGLVDDEKVKGLRVSRRCGQNLAQDPFSSRARKPLEADDCERKDTKRVGVNPVSPAQLPQAFAVDDGEVEAKLLRHLALPLETEGCRADHHHLANPVSQEKFLDNEASFDGLAKTDVVGDQEVHARLAESTDERFELVLLDADPGAKRGLEGVSFGGSDGSPTESVKERRQAVGVVEAIGRDFGERGLLAYAPADLGFPNHPQLFPERVVLDAAQAKEMLTCSFAGQDIGWERARDRVGDHPGASAHLNQPANLGGRLARPTVSNHAHLKYPG